MKGIILLFITLAPFVLFCQPNGLLEEKAFQLFCTNYELYKDSLMRVDVIFNGKITSELSRVYDVAHCFKEINLLTYLQGENPLIDSIFFLNSTKRLNTNKIISTKCERTRRTALCKKKKYRMNVYSSNLYTENRKMVEISLYHEYSGHLVIFAVLFIDNNIADSCFTSLFID